MSIIRDPETYEQFEKVVLVHGCRLVSELAYGDRIMRELPADEYLGDLIRSRLIYFPMVTREPFKNCGRITELMAQSEFYASLGLPDLSPDEDRAMLCGSPDMLRELKAFFLARRFTEGNTGEAGDFVVEKAFVES